MNPDWKTFLIEAGATLAGEAVAHFGDPAAELQAATAGNVLCDLSHLGLIAVRGADAEPFLQGQMTCDVRQISLEHSQLGACCNPKGRMLALFRVFRRGEDYGLRLPRESVEPLLKRLRLYVLRDRIELEDTSDRLARFGAAGPDVEAPLQAALGLLPARADNAVQVAGVTVIRLPGMQPRFELHGTSAELAPLWRTLADHAVPAGAESWRLLDVLAGVPSVYPQTAEAFLPQMTNLQLQNGVSFRKGCYTGQEVVARTQHLGRLKRRMYRARVDATAAPRPGNALFTDRTEPGQDAGRVVEVAPDPHGGYQILAVVAIDLAESHPVRLESSGGPLLEFAPLPYAFEER